MIMDQPHQPHPFQVMCKPIGPLCNLQCMYCYYLDKKKYFPDDTTFQMSPEVLETFIRDYIRSQTHFRSNEIWFSWQGGEPTLLGIDFFRKAVELQKKYCPENKTICNAFQTNGTLLNNEWAAFLGKNKFLVGISIDGPRKLHDRYRTDRTNKPTFDRVMNGLKALRRNGVDFNALTVVHRYNARKPLEVYNFLTQAGFKHIQFIPIVERSTKEQSLISPQHGGVDEDAKVTPWSVAAEDYGHFLKTIFDDWSRKHVGKIFIQFFDVQLGLFSGYPAGLCWFEETCGSGLALEHNGTIYACDHYVYPAYLRGNITVTPLEDLAASRQQNQFGQDKLENLPQYCLRCEFRFACNGGCPKHRFLQTPDGEPGLNYFCSAFKQFFTHAGPALKEMAELMSHGRPAAEFMNLNSKGHRNRQDERIRVGRNQPCPCGSGQKYKRCCGR